MLPYLLAAAIRPLEATRLIVQGHDAPAVDAQFSPDGRRIVTLSEDGEARVWDAGPDGRSARERLDVLRCRVALRLEGAALLPAKRDAAACGRIAPPPPRPPRWDGRHSPLWAGASALQAGHALAACTAFADARSQYVALQDQASLAMLDWAEAALDTRADAAVPDRVAGQIRAIAQKQQVQVWAARADFAQDWLFRPRWALWAMDQARAVAPSSVGLAAMLGPNKLEVLLTAGDGAQALQQAPAIWSMQRAPGWQFSIAALAWLAARQQGNRPQQDVWASRALDGYATLVAQGSKSIGWTTAGSRHAFAVQSNSVLRTQALGLLTLLEQDVSEENLATLAKLLGRPVPGGSSTKR